MLLNQISSGHMVEVSSLVDLINLNCKVVVGRYQEGKKVQDPTGFKKSDLNFLSGEPLPRCWTDPHYSDAELMK